MSEEKTLSFEEAIEKLEASCDKLESGELSLEDSISEFEECIKLIKLCDGKLSSAKQRVLQLTKNDAGEVSDSPFTSDSDET